MNRILAAVILGWLLFTTGGVARADPRQGRMAPDMHFESILENGRPSKLDIRGRAVVLDFWATWCSPCVAAIPKLNKLTAEFNDRPVVFVSVTDEKDEIVTRFLEKHPIRGFVAIDRDGSVFRQYDVTGRPFVVLIDRGGRIAAVTDTYSLTKAAVEELLK